MNFLGSKSFTGSNAWAIILGGSSGFGLASAKKLSKEGLNICIVHRDRRGAMERIEQSFDEIRATGVKFLALNLDALSSEGRATTLTEFTKIAAGGKVRLLLHSIAFGSLKQLCPAPTAQPPAEEPNYLDDDELAMTIFAMGTSLLSWTRDIFKQKLFCDDARILGLTSEGNEIAWLGYAAVSAAKCALESIARSIAREFAPHGIRTNILQPGVTDTPAFRMIPGNAKMAAQAELRNPFGRLTTVEDVAAVVALMTSDEASWINGSLIRVDGGEAIAG